MLKTRIAVLVSGGGTNLQALIDAAKAGKIPDGEIVLVLSDKPDVYALTRAKSVGIATAVVEKNKSVTQEAFENGIIKILTEQNIDMIVLAGFLRILTADFTSRYKNRILNIHPSLIPAFCGEGYYGLRVHRAVLDRGVKLTGATVHYVNEIPDGGEILLQKAVKVQKGDTPEALQRRVMEQAEWKLLPRAVALVSKRIAKEKKHV